MSSLSPSASDVVRGCGGLHGPTIGRTSWPHVPRRVGTRCLHGKRSRQVEGSSGTLNLPLRGDPEPPAGGGRRP
ncbi:hypothetical protein FQU76_09245 [Streptomyces qinzhouensis]|uniref:Uncharacterized protein n=1 Tax=Streptomyces qinzhouensis TaxID=2599401 RepID=A0A5B8J5W2_9ACTN|nr:hypothetical protein FQU76_09245 [Streptomyces qinzhouensis]